MEEELTQLQKERLSMFRNTMHTNSSKRYIKRMIGKEKQKDSFSKKEFIIKIMINTQALFLMRSKYLYICFDEKTIYKSKRVEDCLEVLHVDIMSDSDFRVVYEKACSILSEFIDLDDLKAMLAYNKIILRMEGHNKSYIRNVNYFECNICDYRSVVFGFAAIAAHMRTHIKKYSKYNLRFDIDIEEYCRVIYDSDAKCMLCKKTFTSGRKRLYEIAANHVYDDHINIPENKEIIRYLNELIDAQ